jgi:glycosyltransferase 2 family protein
LQQEAPARGVRNRRLLIVVALLGVLIYVSIALTVDASRVIAALTRLGVAGIAAVLALSLANYLLRFLRWQLYISRFGRHLPVPRHLLIYLSGFAFTLSPGKAGEAIRSMYLRDHGVSYAESLASFFVERMLDVLAMVILAVLIVAAHPAYRGLIAGALIAVVLILIVVSRPGLPVKLSAYTAQRSGRTAKLLEGLANILRSAGRLLQLWPLVWGVALGVLAWATLGLGFYLICQGLHVTISPLSAIGIYSMAVLVANAAIFLPGGIGGFEIVMVALLRDAGVSLQSAVLAALLCSLATLWLAVLIGIVAASIAEIPIAPKLNRAKSISKT